VDGDSGLVAPVLSAQQRAAHDAAKDWLLDPDRKPYFLVHGFAGCGKTTTVVAFGLTPGYWAQFAAWTGKAASVLRRKGGNNAETLHRLLYRPPEVIENEDAGQRLIWRPRDGPLEAGLVIADECSTIDHEPGRELMRRGVPVLVTGDPLQLPPLSGSPFFDGPPDLVLTEVHRMAAASQPLRLATAIRAGEVIKPKPFDMAKVFAAEVTIVALHETRRRINRLWRRAHGVEDRWPHVGDQVLCFKTNYRAGVINGEIWTIERLAEEGENLRLRLVDDLRRKAEVVVPERHFLLGAPRQLPQDGLDIFDFGYAITCWKAQGSEWDNVAVIDETSTYEFRWIAEQSGLPFAEFKARWLYTAVTRAAKHVWVMEPPR
jgi:exodeoxyribonuclease-5